MKRFSTFLVLTVVVAIAAVAVLVAYNRNEIDRKRLYNSYDQHLEVRDALYAWLDYYGEEEKVTPVTEEEILRWLPSSSFTTEMQADVKNTLQKFQLDIDPEIIGRRFSDIPEHTRSC